MSFHHRPRYTKDLDLWIDSSDVNLKKVYRALAKFGAPPHVLGDLQAIRPRRPVNARSRWAPVSKKKSNILVVVSDIG